MLSLASYLWAFKSKEEILIARMVKRSFQQLYLFMKVYFLCELLLKNQSAGRVLRRKFAYKTAISAASHFCQKPVALENSRGTLQMNLTKCLQ